MRKITPISDDDLLLEVEPQTGVVFKEYATDIIVLWDETKRDVGLGEKYERFRLALENRFGCHVNKGTAHLVLDEAVRLVGELKKTHIVLLNLNLSESPPAVEAPQN